MKQGSNTKVAQGEDLVEDNVFEQTKQLYRSFRMLSKDDHASVLTPIHLYVQIILF